MQQLMFDVYIVFSCRQGLYLFIKRGLRSDFSLSIPPNSPDTGGVNPLVIRERRL